MPVTVHSGATHGNDHMSAAISAVQAAVGGVTVKKNIDRQLLGAHIIELQKRLVVLGKLNANKVSTYIDDQYLGQKLAEVEAAANT